MNYKSIICNRHAFDIYFNKSQYCKICGTLFMENVNTIRPIQFSYYPDQNPYEYFKLLNSKITLVCKTRINNLQFNRKEILKNIFKITEKLIYLKKTFFMSVYYFDFIYSLSNPECKPELVALTCIIIAAKFCEVDPCLPEKGYFQTAYPKMFFKSEQISQCEAFCLKVLNYTLNQTTSYTFLEFVMYNGFIFSDENLPNQVSTPKSFKSYCLNNSDIQQKVISSKIYSYLYDTHFKLIQDSRIIHLNPINLVYSCVAITREFFKIKVPWNKNLETIYGISFSDFKECHEICKEILNIQTVTSSPTPKNSDLQNLRKKFSLNIKSLYSEYELKSKIKKKNFNFVSIEESVSKIKKFENSLIKKNFLDSSKNEFKILSKQIKNNENKQKMSEIITNEKSNLKKKKTALHDGERLNLTQKFDKIETQINKNRHISRNISANHQNSKCRTNSAFDRSYNEIERSFNISQNLGVIKKNHIPKASNLLKKKLIENEIKDLKSNFFGKKYIYQNIVQSKKRSKNLVDSGVKKIS